MLFKKSQHGWRLMQQSLRVMQEEKKFWIFPLLGRGFFFMVIIAAVTMIWIIRSGKIDYNQLTAAQVLWGYVVLLLSFWLAHGVSAYFNEALIAGLLQKENAEGVSIKKCLRTATKQLWTIITWIGAHFTLGLFLMIFRSKAKSKPIKKLLSGLDWAFATYLIGPVIINEPNCFTNNLQRSSQLMRDFAGTQPKINYSFFWISFILRLLCLIPLFVGEAINQPFWLITGMVITGLLILSVMMMFNAVFVIITQGLYHYIAHGKITHHFKVDDLATAVTRSE